MRSAHKTFGDVHIKSESEGVVEAVFARIADPDRPDVKDIDKDGDVTFPGAFGEQNVVISAYGHASWPHRGNELPVGHGTIFEDGQDAVLQGRFLMGTTHGRETFETVKGLADLGLGEWSYGYDTLDDGTGVWAGRRAHFLKKQLVTEVSPVLRGAGLTRTTYAKAAVAAGFRPEDVVELVKESAVTDWHAAIRPHTTTVVNRRWNPDAAVKAVGEATVDELRSMFAWADPTGDPTVKTSYRFAHHDAPGGPANLRALITGIAALNGAPGGVGVPDGDRKAVYEHLAGHLDDADRVIPELKSSSDAPTVLQDEIAAALAGVSAVIASAETVDAIRAQKGKRLSNVNVELLGWIDETLKDLKSLLTQPDDAIADEFARFVKLQHGGSFK